MGKRCIALLLLAAVGLLVACSGVESRSINTSDYDDPPESERLYTLTIYWQFDIMSGDSSVYSFSREGIVEEGSRDDPSAASASDIEIFDATPPGGRNFCFRGVSPGDVVLTMRNENKGKITYERKYILRVYDDLRLAVLDVIED